MISKVQLLDTFRGDNQHLISSIKALLTLDAKGSLIPHGIGGHARELLSSAAVRLGEQHQGEPVALPARKADPTEESDVFTDAENSGFNACLDEIAKLGPLFTHTDAGESERLRTELAGTIAESERRRNCCADLIEERDALRAEMRAKLGIKR